MAERLAHISRIEPNPENPRRDLGDVTELADSIRAVGLLEPLVVQPHPWKPGHYELLAGERRLAACKLARVDQVPIVVRAGGMDPTVAGLVENCHRKELTAVERAEAMGKLRDEQGWSRARIAKETGLSAGTVSRTLELLELDAGSRERVRSGLVKVGDARAAVRTSRAATRTQRGAVNRGRKVTVDPPHFSTAHRLSPVARAACREAGHKARKYGVACGQCWETAIRQDEQSRASTPQLAAVQ